MNGVLADRVALITGSSRGIGRSIALELSRDGAFVVLVGRDAGCLDRVREEVLAEGGRGEFLTFDLFELGRIPELLAGVESRWGPVDILINNAGMAPTAPLETTSDEVWEQCFRLNLLAPEALSGTLLDAMAARGFGRVVHVASTAGLRGYRFTSAYCASKHGLVGLAKAQAAGIRHSDVTVNAVCPGFVDTDLTREAVQRIVEATGRSADEARALLAAENPMGRLLAPEEVAAAVAFLCRPSSGSLNGVALPLGGPVGHE